MDATHRCPCGFGIDVDDFRSTGRLALSLPDLAPGVPAYAYCPACGERVCYVIVEVPIERVRMTFDVTGD